MLRSGHSAADTGRLVRALNERHSDSNLDRMRQIFVNVPVIYGFSSKAPLGATAGPLLDRYFQPGSGNDAANAVGSMLSFNRHVFDVIGVSASGFHGVEVGSKYI